MRLVLTKDPVRRLDSHIEQSRIARNGFTITEFLVVIVIIGVLAAIVIVAFNAVKARASGAKLDSAVKAYATSIELYRAQNGSYPNTGTGCFGVASDYPAVSGFAAGSCVLNVAGNTNDLINTNLNTALQPYLNSPPSFISDIQQRDFGGGTVYRYRGAWVEILANYYQIQYFKTGNQTCPVGQAVKDYYASDNTTRCLITKSV